MIKLAVADSSVLVREGFRALLADQTDFTFVVEVDNSTTLKDKIRLFKPDVLILDFNSISLPIAELKTLLRQFKNLKVLAITNLISKNEIKAALDTGICSYLLKDCDKEEIKEAIHQTSKGERFLCGKIADILLSPSEITVNPAYLKNISCEGFGITEREMDIIRLVAEGLSNKQIADKLFLSTHTVNTHRKNIMSKLGVNNTAGVVLFAVKNNILEPNNFLFS
jgi:DNA-binding NarL/FixJ family response regulator